MGRKRTVPNQCRGKYKKRKRPLNHWEKIQNEARSDDSVCTDPMTSPESPTSLDGSRIINMQSLQTFVKNVSTHSSICNETVSLVGETCRSGLASVLCAKCSGCDLSIQFPTSAKVTGASGRRRWEVNLAATWGQMATRGGHSQLEEQMSVLGVPVMTKRTFVKTEKAIGKWWSDSLEESMREAAEEEKRLAIEKGSFHEGVPAITVIVDGGWSKRAHKHSYNAKSGVAIVIGQETGKILHLGVRNKFCSVCTTAENKSMPTPPHECLMNWDGPSSSMETDILVSAFREAEKKYGLRYTSFVGDGDSSVYINLIAEVPGWGYVISKIECANHAIKCYRSALEKLVQEKPQYRGKGKLTELMRKRLTAAARCAIKMRSQEPDKTRAVQLLREDLRNGPLHCFGIHTRCSTDYCKTIQADRTNFSSTATTCASSSTFNTTHTPSCSTATTSCSTAAPSCSITTPSCSTAAPSCSTAAPSCSIAAPSCFIAAPSCSTPSCSTAAPSCSTAAPSCFTVTPSCSTAAPFGSTTNSTHFSTVNNVSADDDSSLGMCDYIYDVASCEETAWRDALDDDNLEEVRSVPVQPSQTIDPEMLCDIQLLVSRLIAKAPQLLGNFTTNLAESWMHVRSKFDGGKQVNRSQGGSWEARCAGAGLRHNHGPDWGPKVWEAITGEEASSVFKQVSNIRSKEVAKARERKRSDAAKENRRKSKHKKSNDNSQKARNDYARHDGDSTVLDVSSDVPQLYLEDLMMQFYTTYVEVTQERAIQLEQMTRFQGTASNQSTNLWLAERRKRITSSVAGQIAKRRPTTKVCNMVKALLYKQFKGNVATEWGKEQESASQNQYEQYHSSRLTVQSCGLVIHPVHSWLAASPDGLVCDPYSHDTLGLVEYKNPYSHRDESLLTAAATAKEFCLKIGKDGNLSLKKTHNYYYQVQMAMYCARRNWCDFVVRTSVDFFVERVHIDTTFVAKTVAKLRSFYFNAVLPELALPRRCSGGIREPSDWLKHVERWRGKTGQL